MPTISFTIPGEPQGYYACGKTPNWDRKNRYHAYCEKVRIYALQAGVTLPLVATKNNTLSIHVRPVFSNGHHCDPGNVQKGVCDALFYSKHKPKGSGDKWTGGSFPPPIYCDVPRTEVQIQYFNAESATGGLLPSASNASDPALKPAATIRAEPCSANPTKKSRPVKKSIWGDRA